MQKTQQVATALGFILISVVQIILPNLHLGVTRATASPDFTYPFLQTGATITADYPESPQLMTDNFTVGLQVGHDHQTPPPAELASIERNTGAQSGSKTEVESNKRIVREVAKLLESEGITVEILHATVPKRYKADLFLTIHADGSPNTRATGFKNAAPSNDKTGKGARIVKLLDEEYMKATGLSHDKENITQNMLQYYAFNYNRFEHAISSTTPAAIVETGFITNPRDQVLIYDNPQIPARGIARAVVRFLELEKLERSAQMDEPAAQDLREKR